MAQANPPGVLAPFKGQRQLHPGIRVQVGQHVVTVKRFLSQGGFAHVYLVQADRPVRLPSGEQTTSLVLKHMCVWNKDALRSVRAEVEHHRELHGHTSIVHFVEASAANLQGDGWEIFILMECCAGGGLIDFLNTRLQNRLTEKEVLTIFRDVCRGVQVMHAKQLVHRDLKIENILLSQSDPPQFKLCDFGSCFSARGIRPAVTPEDKKRLEAELNMHTTIWYRAPEMVDLRLEQLIDQRADVWALGVLFLEELNSRAAVRKLAANYNKSEQPLADEDEAPEDAGPNPLFRVRARDSVAIDMEPSVRDELASINTASSARQERAPVRSLSELLAEESARNTGDTSATAEPPKQDELASLAEHEKALEALLQPGPTTEEPESVEGPVVGDLLGIEGLSVSSRASAWEKGRECNDKASEASKPGRPSAPMADPPASEHTSPDLAAVESQPETQSGSAEAAAPSEHPSDVETRTDMPASEEKPSDTRGGSRRPSHDSAGSLDRTRSVAAAKPPAPKPGTKPSALPPPSRARPAQNKPIKVAPAREPSSPRSTSPPELPTPQRSATWDVASKPRVAPKPKQYVDAATSPGIQSPTELPVVTPGTDSDVLVNTPNIRARMAQLQQSSQTHAPPVTASKLPLERRSSRVSLDKKAEERAQSAERLEAKTKSEARTSVPSKATAAREGPSEPSRNPYAASRDEKDDSPRVPEGLSAALLSQRSGQVRLTKRPTQSAHLEKPWEKEAAAARQRQGQVMVGADATPESETADEPFAGVNALINRWQSRNS
ncbi:non-specific serine/threonine protein kinase [Malassezia obtusa]|uniref:non-specific serine/threonine protein kinase n=1 Tax=Malassezia obtusa TaxID=76774 RepID=A0AAF0ISF4_9BASI|nr:non-specific serine/threonine protein kinase [Malassezia obtusa]